MTTPTTTVPAEPTEAMIEAGAASYNNDVSSNVARSIWAAMLAAAPVPSPHGKEVREAVARIVREAIARRMAAEVDPVRSFDIKYRWAERDAAITEATDAILALLTPARSGWRPIESAPKDGTAFVAIKGRLAFRTFWQQYYVKWPHEEGGPTFRGQWTYEDSSSMVPWNPTHWMPLPVAPSEGVEP